MAAARAVYAELGPDAPIETIARRAGVGERTLYRRFRTTADLIGAALDQALAETLLPAIEVARRRSDPFEGLAGVIEAAISFGAHEYSLLTAARRAGVLTSEVAAPLNATMDELTRAAQRAGLVRADLEAEDLPRLIAMLHSVLWTMEPDSDGWRRYVALVLDAISTRTRTSLPTLVPLRYADRSGSWPM